METQSKIFTLLNKVSEIQKGKNTLLAKKQKIKLGKVDELDYEYSVVEDEYSKLSYFVEEAFDELFAKAVESWQMLNDVFKNNSENFWRFEDELANDKIKLEEIQVLADELGVDVTEVYPDFEEHYNIIVQGMTLDALYDEKEREFDTYFG
jgi:hypothetical protein